MVDQRVSTEGEHLASARERILVLLAVPGAARLLRAMLTKDYDVVCDLTAEPFDCCIVDGPELLRNRDALQAARAARAPAVLPILLLAERLGLGSIAPDAWEIVDDVLLMPLEMLELRARVEAMVRLRRLSSRLRRVADATEGERAIARRLQAEAQPRSLPAVPGLVFDGFYRGSRDLSRIGGDWYDAFRLQDGRIVLSVGDVNGSGLDAAVTMANVRSILRGVAHIHADPATMLDAVDRTLQGDGDSSRITAFVGIFDPVTSLLSYASGGQPRVRLIEPDGTQRELGPTAEVIDVPPEGTLVLSTRDRSDAARLNMRRVGDDSAIRRWSFASEDAVAARRARDEAARALAGHGLLPDAVSTAELLFAELVGNVVRYAGGATEVALDFAGRSPVLHVLDRGTGFRHMPKLPSDVLSETGRGLYIVSAFAEDFTVTRRPGGGSHARAVLSLDGGDPFVARPNLDITESNELVQP